MAEGDSTQLCWPEGRRRKALIFVLACLGAGAAPHWLGPLRGLLPALGAALLLCGYGLRTMFSSSVDMEPCLPVDGANQLPRVDVLVAARDEEAVIGRLVQAVAD